MATKIDVDAQHAKLITLKVAVDRAMSNSNRITEFQINGTGSFLRPKSNYTFSDLTDREQDDAYTDIEAELARIKAFI